MKKEKQMLINALKIIASPYNLQKSYYPDYVLLGDELANELSDYFDIFPVEYLLRQNIFTVEILDEIMKIDNEFLVHSLGEKEYSPDLWTEEAIRKSVFWERQRERASLILKKYFS